MKLLIDESLSSSVARFLNDVGHDAMHVCDLDLLGAPDEDVMAAARQDSRVIVSLDTDFGGLLALGGHSEPSVLLLRRGPHRPEEQAKLLATALDVVGADLAAGAIVVLTHGRARVRRLPVE